MVTRFISHIYYIVSPLLTAELFLKTWFLTYWLRAILPCLSWQPFPWGLSLESWSLVVPAPRPPGPPWPLLVNLPDMSQAGHLPSKVWKAHCWALQQKTDSKGFPGPRAWGNLCPFVKLHPGSRAGMPRRVLPAFRARAQQPGVNKEALWGWPRSGEEGCRQRELSMGESGSRENGQMYPVFFPFWLFWFLSYLEKVMSNKSCTKIPLFSSAICSPFFSPSNFDPTEISVCFKVWGREPS